MIDILKVTTEQEMQSVKQIRTSVFIREEHIDPNIEMDSLDQEAVHFLAYWDHQPVGTCRILLPLDSRDATIGRVCVLTPYRHKGIASALLHQAELYIREQHRQRIILHAQCSVIGLYEKCGYIPFGPVFEEAGISHQAMEKDLNALSTNQEIEYKVLVTKKELERVRAMYPGNRDIIQVNHYFCSEDNPALVFRMREISNTWLFTYKKHLDVGRMEYEKNLSSCDLNDPDILQFLDKNGSHPPFIELGHLRTHRRETDLPNEAHLCLDSNSYGRKKDFEIEYEISGPDGSLDRFKSLLSSFGIAYRPSPLSKQARALKEYSSLNRPH